MDKIGNSSRTNDNKESSSRTNDNTLIRTNEAPPCNNPCAWSQTQ